LRNVRRFLRLRVTTSEAASVRFTGRTTRRKTLVRARRVSLAKKGTHTVTLKLTAAGRKAVKQAARKRQRARLTVVVSARATDKAGNRSSKTLRKTLRR
jgi:hypothetical protein